MMNKAFWKSVCSLLIALFAFGAVSFNSFAESECTNHIFVNGVCQCGTYYVEAGKTVKIPLLEKGIRLSGVAWTVPVDSVVAIDDRGVEGFFEETTYYAIVKGLREGEGTVLAYSKGTLAQTTKVVVECKNHLFEEFVSDNNATCLDGTKTAKCEYCDETQTVTDVGSAVHYVKTYTSNGDATCTVDGTKSGICSECGIKFTLPDENSKKPHDYQNYVSDNNATCISDGTKTGACSVCGKKNTVTEEKSALGHNFAEYISDNNATCTEDGTMTAKCTRCDVTDTKIDLFSRLGHGYGEWITVKEMHCLEDGLIERACIRCDLKQSEVIEKTGHNYIYQTAMEPTCKEEGRTSGMYCSNCNTVFVESKPKPKLEHEQNESVDPASLTENGTYMITCKNCDEIFAVETIYRPKTVKLEKTSFTYNGKTVTPVVVIKDANENDLIEGVDYTLSYNLSIKAIGEYTVKVSFKGRYEGTKSLAFTVHPAKTDKIEATQTTDTVTLKWNKVKNATGYRVYQYNSKTGKYEKFKTLTSTTHTVKKLKAGTKYKYAVKAYTKTSDGKTIWAKEYVVITTATKPATLKVTATAGSKQVALKWSKVTGATGYQVYMQAPGEGYKKIKVTADSKYTVKSLKKGITYKFRVRAYSKVDGKYIYGGYKTYSVKVK